MLFISKSLSILRISLINFNNLSQYYLDETEDIKDDLRRKRAYLLKVSTRLVKSYN